MDFREVEKKWQKFWEQHPQLYRAVDETGNKKQKQYILVEFPYPSGSGLHIGHAFSFTGGDVYARFKRMQGYNVLFPMGWDAFGLPTENYAIRMKRKPQEVTKENTEMFKRQMKELAFSFDWEREVNTTDPNYYKWTQWIFIKLFENGLAYKQEMPINWCPSCKIGLANEEVVSRKVKSLKSESGETINVCERCRAEVSRRNISQWVVKISDYADRLISGLEKTAFIDKVKAAQVNWIGKSEGARINFQLKITNYGLKTKTLEVFTTRPDTLHGVTFMVIAPEHELVSEILNPSFGSPLDRGEDKMAPCPVKGRGGEGFDLEKIKNYLKQARSKSDLERAELTKEKTGVFSGLYAVNPVNNKEIPIWISDFVLNSYGTGAIMSVPAHDERDEAFAKKYGLEIIEVVSDGVLANSEMLNDLGVEEAKEKIIKWLEEKGIGKRASSYHLRDWIFSRQHYWGEPIPMIFCAECAKQTYPLTPSLDRVGEESLPCQGEIQRGLNAGWQPVPEDQLPVKLPEVEAYEPTDDGQSPLAKMTSWVKTTCPVCGGEAKRETDTMPNWAGSDWYYLAYCFANKINNQSPITNYQTITNDQFSNSRINDTFVDIFSSSREELKKWLPVDVYIGGDEHNTLHLLYSRFIHQFLFDLGVVPAEEPYYRRLSHGVILGPDGQRMSKSRGNVIVPDDIANKYGVDVVRMYLMFMGPFEATMVWNEKTLNGVKRFLERFERLITNYQLRITNDSSREVKVIINKLIEGVTKDLEGFGFNTAIAKLMQALNELTSNKKQITIEEIKTLVKLIAPMAPYLAEELWAPLCQEATARQSVHVVSWPKADPKYLVEETISIPVAVNGLVRAELAVKSQKSKVKSEVLRLAKDMEKIRKWIEGKKIIREIYVPGKMINLVVE